MPGTADIEWFKTTFGGEIEAATSSTVFDVDMLTAIACQETGYLWQVMRRKGLATERIVSLCCGDTLDSDKGRKAFPRTKAELVARERGDEMFAIARQALLDMSEHVPGFGFAKNRKDKFCHGFGVFQRDLQFFKTDPDYFLKRRYESFGNSLAHALGELNRGLKSLKLGGKGSISDFEFCTVAIAYNTGSYNPKRGLKQGHKSDDGKYYGEAIFDFLALSRTISTKPGSAPQNTPAVPGSAIVVPVAKPEATGPFFDVDTKISSLRLRNEPRISSPLTANVLAELPDGHRVRSITGQLQEGFIEVEAKLGGALFRGFASGDYLKKVSTLATAEVSAVKVAAEATVPEAHMSRKPGSVTRREDIAGAHSLNEPNMPGRIGGDVDELRHELATIIAFLAPDRIIHKRYQPRAGLTFCNIYAHDYCALAGVYLPRVWWTGPALIRLAGGDVVKPLYGDTIVEVRANDLFRWLRDFGSAFGWRQAISTNEIQQAANQGAIASVVARRKEDGRSGHITMVVPETNDHRARRDVDGRVTAPLQSQAGASNFSYGTGQANWWLDPRFAESAFWFHA